MTIMDKLILPPLLNAICSDQPFEAAIEQVRRRKSGAGDLFWCDEEKTGRLAIVLEPEVARGQALEMLPLAMVALSDCLAVLLPPQVGVGFRGHNNLVVNDGVAGGLRAAISKTGESSDVPDWLVLGIEIGLCRSISDVEPGLDPDVTTMDEEGWEDVNHHEFVETYARHFLSWLAVWTDDGFSTIARAWKFKAENRENPPMKEFKNYTIVFESTL